MNKYLFCITAMAILLLSSCQDVATTNFSPIVLGDSSLIVTETNPAFLKNEVEDIDPKTTRVDNSAAPIVKDTLTQKIVVDKVNAASRDSTAETANKNDFVINIENGTSIVFSNIKTKSYRNQQPDKSNSLTYQITNGSLEKLTITVINGKLTGAKQKYTSSVFANFNDAKFEVDALGTYNTGYQVVKVNGNSFNVANLQQPAFKKISKSAIINGLEKTIKAKKYSKSLTNSLLKDARKVQTVNQAPLSVKLSYAVWQITGVDSKGKTFTKEIRLDK